MGKYVSTTSKAKYYIYRNLHTGTFSVKHKGKVIAHPKSIVALDVEFRVSQKGRAKVLAERKKYVHAYVVCDSWFDESMESPSSGHLTEVLYNPFKYRAFVNSVTEQPQGNVGAALLTDGKVFIHEVNEGL